ncbi:HET-domain-containing protein, partial [Hyaloscypha variabilis F]
MEVAQLQSFTYSVLPSSRHIRVLELQQDGNTLALLSATLCNLDLDDEDRIPYSALSYTWGQPEFTERLILNSAAAYITPNLAAALQYLRVLGCMRIWVDAVCIDQTNNDEKSSQIPLMANIYRNASRVIVWLGNDIAAIEAMKVARAARRDPRPTKDNTSIHPTEHVPEASAALNVLVHLPWFGRRWVVQEV